MTDIDLDGEAWERLPGSCEMGNVSGLLARNRAGRSFNPEICVGQSKPQEPLLSRAATAESQFWKRVAEVNNTLTAGMARIARETVLTPGQ